LFIEKTAEEATIKEEEKKKQFNADKTPEHWKTLQRYLNARLVGGGFLKISGETGTFGKARKLQSDRGGGLQKTVTKELKEF